MPSQSSQTILFLAANPKQTNQLQLDKELRSVDSALQTTLYRQNFDLRSHWAVEPSDLQGLLLRYQPSIVHFSGHGSTSGELILHNIADEAVPVLPETLASLFGILRDNVRCVLL